MGQVNFSDILRAIYYGAQNGANVVNMSFDLKTSSLELQKALDYANQKGVICAASAGNDGVAEIVYPAALANRCGWDVASTTDQDRRSSFSNFGTIVWVALPAEAIVTTYPFQHLCGGMGNSFSAPLVSGGAALLHNLNAAINQSSGAAAVAHAVLLADPGMGNGRLDLCSTLGSVSAAMLSAGLQRFCVTTQRDDYGGTAGNLHRLRYTAAWFHSDCNVELHRCTTPGDMRGFAIRPVTIDGKIAATATVTLSTTGRAFSRRP